MFPFTRVKFSNGARKKIKELIFMSLEITDLIGLVEIEVVSAQIAEKDGQRIPVVEAKQNGEPINAIGFFGEDTIKSALEKGKKEGGKKFLKVPANKVTKGEKKISWISAPY